MVFPETKFRTWCLFGCHPVFRPDLFLKVAPTIRDTPKTTWRRCEMGTCLSVENQFHAKPMTVQRITSNCSQVKETLVTMCHIQTGFWARFLVFQWVQSSAIHHFPHLAPTPSPNAGHWHKCPSDCQDFQSHIGNCLGSVSWTDVLIPQTSFWKHCFLTVSTVFAIFHISKTNPHHWCSLKRLKCPFSLLGCEFMSQMSQQSCGRNPSRSRRALEAEWDKERFVSKVEARGTTAV